MAIAAQDNDEMITSINVTPLVDITLVLLIILMITASYVASKAIPLDLPKGATAETTPVTLSVSIDKDGKMYHEAAPIDDAGLRAKVRATSIDDRRMTDPVSLWLSLPPNVRLLPGDRIETAGELRALHLLRREEVTKFAINVDPEDVGTPLPNPLPASRGEGTGR